MKTKYDQKKTRRMYQKPVVKHIFKESDFLTKELPFVGSTSVYKTFVPMRKNLQV